MVKINRFELRIPDERLEPSPSPVPASLPSYTQYPQLMLGHFKGKDDHLSKRKGKKCPVLSQDDLETEPSCTGLTRSTDLHPTAHCDGGRGGT